MSFITIGSTSSCALASTRLSRHRYLEVYGDARREEDMEEDVEGGEGSDTEDEDEDGDA